ncbi:hypothetical protein ACEQUB_p01199 (plasmid) [Ralstonia syzygii]
MDLSAFCGFVRVVTTAVVFHMQLEITAVDHGNGNPARNGVLANVGKRFLEDEKHLQLLSGRQRRAAILLVAQVRRDAGLPFETRQRLFDGGPERALFEFGTKVQQQLAHVLIAFLNAAAQQRNDLARFAQVLPAYDTIDMAGIGEKPTTRSGPKRLMV